MPARIIPATLDQRAEADAKGDALIARIGRSSPQEIDQYVDDLLKTATTVATLRAAVATLAKLLLRVAALYLRERIQALSGP